jgi:outer membrane lipoprotein-sorting protein
MRVLLRTAVPVLVLAVAAVAALHAQSVDEIIARNIEAKGGAEKLRGVQSMKLTGKLSGRGMEAPFTIWSKRPNLARQETEMQGTHMVRAFDGTKAWMMIGPDAQEIAGPQAQSTRDQAEFDTPLLDYKTKGHTVELVGTETVGGTKAYHLKLTTKGGQVQHFFIDAETGVERQTSMTLDQDGQQMNIVTDLSDFRDVDGIKVPFSVKQTVNGTPITTLLVDKVQFNIPIDDALFRMPRKPQQ